MHHERVMLTEYLNIFLHNNEAFNNIKFIHLIQYYTHRYMYYLNVYIKY